MTSQLEEDISRYLRSILAELAIGADISESAEFRSVLSGLEHFVELLLCEKYSYWKHESLDGLLVMGRKVGPEEAEFNGFCILITDQTVTPAHIRLRLSASDDEIEWMKCCLGEPGMGEGKMKRTPYASWSSKKLINLCDHTDSIDWVYRFEFGQESLHSKTTDHRQIEA